MAQSKYDQYGMFSLELQEFLKNSATPIDMASTSSIDDMRIGLQQVEEMWWNTNRSAENGPLVTDIAVTARDGAKIPLCIWQKRNRDARPRPIAFAVHGGGWTLGTAKSDSFLIRTLLEDLDMTVVTVDYRLAPEYPYPVPFNDVCDAFSWLVSQVAGPKQMPGFAADFEPPLSVQVLGKSITLCGFSAGGNLCAALTTWAKEKGAIQNINHLILFSPATCHYKQLRIVKERTGSELNSIDTVSTPILDGVALRSFWDNYDPGSGESQYVSPLLTADLSGFPPVYIQICGADPLRDEGFAYAESLRKAGNPVTVKVCPGMPHGYHSDIIGFESRQDVLDDFVQYMKDYQSSN